MQILIRNIDRKITQPEILAMLREYGRVVSCDLVMDAKTGFSKGFAFAEMPNISEFTKAIEELDGKKMGSLKLRVKRAANSSILKKPGS